MSLRLESRVGVVIGTTCFFFFFFWFAQLAADREAASADMLLAFPSTTAVGERWWRAGGRRHP